MTKTHKFCPASYCQERECVNHLLLFNHLIIIFQLAAFLLYHIVLILWNAVRESILIIGDGKYNVKVEKLFYLHILSAAEYGLRFGLRSGRSGPAASILTPAFIK